jgi:hypothetical protein
MGDGPPSLHPRGLASTSERSEQALRSYTMNSLPIIPTKIARKATLATAIAALAAFSAGPDAGLAATHNARLKPGFSLRIAKAHLAVRVGSTATYKIVIRRAHFTGPVTLRIASKLPSGATVRFSANRTRRSSSTLTVRTSQRTAPRSYRLRLSAKSGKLTRTSSLTLAVATAQATGPASGGTNGGAVTGGTLNGSTLSIQPPSFTLAGNVAGSLEPGTPRALNLQITNPNPRPLIVSGLSTSIRAVSAPAATAALPCTLSGFSAQQFSGRLPLTVPASSTRTLAQLGVPAAQWPQISIVNLPTNQDGCKGASLALAYTGAATLG